MRVVKNIIQYILVAILAIAIFALIIINLFSSSILSKDYVLSKLAEQNYYDKIYEDTKSNFENYIHQSGLDEEVLNDIVTKEKIKKDTNIIIDNIYNGMDEKISTEEIKNNLNENIKNSLNGKISSTQQKAIDVFVDTICEEYKSTISHTKYEQKINEGYKTIQKYINMAKKGLMIAIGVCLILLVMIAIKRIYRIIARIGTAFTIDGLLLLLGENYVSLKVKISSITILNNATSDVLRSILNEILNNTIKYGSILLSAGFVLIVIYGLIKSMRKAKREKEQYTPEN